MEGQSHSHLDSVNLVELPPLTTTFDTECSICLENGNKLTNKFISFTKLNCCKNIICKHCICSWIAHKGLSADCPFCRDTHNIYTNVSCSDLIDYIITIKTQSPMLSDQPQHQLTTAIDNINQVFQNKYSMDNIVVQIGENQNTTVTTFHHTRYLELAKNYLLLTVGCGVFLYSIGLIMKLTT